MYDIDVTASGVNGHVLRVERVSAFNLGGSLRGETTSADTTRCCGVCGGSRRGYDSCGLTPTTSRVMAVYDERATDGRPSVPPTASVESRQRTKTRRRATRAAKFPAMKHSTAPRRRRRAAVDANSRPWSVGRLGPRVGGGVVAGNNGPPLSVLRCQPLQPSGGFDDDVALRGPLVTPSGRCHDDRVVTYISAGSCGCCGRRQCCAACVVDILMDCGRRQSLDGARKPPRIGSHRHTQTHTGVV